MVVKDEETMRNPSVVMTAMDLVSTYTGPGNNG